MDSNAARNFARALRNAVIDLRTIRDTPPGDDRVEKLKMLASRSIRELMSELEVETETQLCQILNIG